MNLNSRLTRLERAIGTEACDCADSADFSWPGHQPPLQCANCGGERLIYTLQHKPRATGAELRAVLPLLRKACAGEDRASYDRLTDQELRQLKDALAPLDRGSG